MKTRQMVGSTRKKIRISALLFLRRRSAWGLALALIASHANLSGQSAPPGASNRAPQQQGAPQGYGQQGPPPGVAGGSGDPQQMAPQGYGQQGPPPGVAGGGQSQQMAPQGYGPGGQSQGPPPGVAGGGYPGGSAGAPQGYGPGASQGPPAGVGGYPGAPGMAGPGTNTPPATGSSLGNSSEVVQTYAASLTSAISEIDLLPLFGASSQAAVVESGPVLNREAEQAFKSGYHQVALDLMFGHMAAEYPESQQALNQVKYSRLLRRPVWAVRWGVSMSVRGDSPDDPQPIREGATPMGQRVAGGGGRGGFGPAGGGPSDFETGGFGPGGGPGGPGFNEEMMEDGMGEMEDMGQMEGMGEMEEMGAAGGFGRPAARPNPVADTAARPQRSMLSAQADETLQEPLGLVAEIAAESFDKRFKQGAFGSLFTSVTAPAVAPPTTQQTGFGNRTVPVASPVTTSNDLEEVLVNVPQPLPMWKPGIVFVGQNVDSDELLAQARATGLDLLMHFDVVLKEGRDGQVSNLSRCRLLRVSSGKSLGVSKSFDSNEAANFAAAGRMNEREYVEEQFSNFWGIVDREVTVQPMPPLKAAAAQSRIASLLSSADSNSLRTLAEVRLFQSAGLITDEEAELAFHIVGGSDGLVMMHGPREQRQEKVRQWTRGNKD